MFPLHHRNKLRIKLCMNPYFQVPVRFLSAAIAVSSIWIASPSVFAVESPAVTPIFDIQGAGHRSPWQGQTVTTTGIVTAVDSNGFYLQDPLGDGNSNTSDGLFIFTSSRPRVSVRDEVQVTGTVSEFIPGGAASNNLSITQIDRPTQITPLSSGNPLPAPVILGTGGRIPPNRIIDNDNFTRFDPRQDGIDFYESLEGMRVTIQSALAVSPTNRFGEIYTVVDNGAVASGLSRRGTLNIETGDFNPERVQVQFDSGILPGFRQEVGVGAQLGNVTGVVSYGFGNYEVSVTDPFTPVRNSALVPEVTGLMNGRRLLTIATYNVLNLDPNDSDGDTDVADGRFDTIARHIVNNLKSPDIIALQEIQDNDGSRNTSETSADATLQLLIDRIRAIGGATYAYIDNPFIGDDTSGGQPGGNIRTAYLYNPSRVSPLSNSILTVTDPVDQQTNPANPFFETRLPLVVTFQFGSETVTLINNHFSSKGGSSPLFGQVQPSVVPGSGNEGQENPAINGSLQQRRVQAETVRAFVDSIIAGGQLKVVVLGDLNEFEFISPLTILEQSLFNFTRSIPRNERYTFIFDGNSQSLDHILVSPALAPAARLDIVHVNTEFVDTPQRASDHDPSLVRLLFQN